MSLDLIQVQVYPSNVLINNVQYSLLQALQAEERIRTWGGTTEQQPTS